MRDSEILDKSKKILADAKTVADTNKATAVVSIDGKDIEKTAKWVLQTDMTAYTNAISAADTIANKAEATQTEVDNAVITLATATTAFNNAKKDGIKVVAADKTALTDAKTAAVKNKGTVILSTDGKDVEKTEKWVLEADLVAYTKAISAAAAIANKAEATQIEVDNAVTTLGIATVAFNTAKKDGIK